VDRRSLLQQDKKRRRPESVKSGTEKSKAFFFSLRRKEMDVNVEPGAMLCEMHDELSSIRCVCFCMHVPNGAHCSEERGVRR
jgi:hypothetical protein